MRADTFAGRLVGALAREHQQVARSHGIAATGWAGRLIGALARSDWPTASSAGPSPGPPSSPVHLGEGARRRAGELADALRRELQVARNIAGVAVAELARGHGRVEPSTQNQAEALARAIASAQAGARRLSVASGRDTILDLAHELASARDEALRLTHEVTRAEDLASHLNQAQALAVELAGLAS